LLNNGTITVAAGGAITALSDPESEVDEVLLKAQAVAGAINYKVEFKKEDV
jgi:anthranilate/para-aminobenzoate synthase component I